MCGDAALFAFVLDAPKGEGVGKAHAKLCVGVVDGEPDFGGGHRLDMQPITTSGEILDEATIFAGATGVVDGEQLASLVEFARCVVFADGIDAIDAGPGDFDGAGL